MKLLRTQSAMITILAGGIITLFGTYWDDAWHTDLGRDTFASPPHLLLYGGVALAGLGVGLWGVVLFLQERKLRAVIRNPPFLLAAVGIVATFLSAPIDEFWHNAFGRDAVLWSPPHMLGVVALLVVTVSLLLESRRLPNRSGRLISYGASALVIAATLVPVMEYETDVPQFALAWYFPVMAFGTAFAFSLIKMTLQTQWSVTLTAIIYTGLRIAITVFLIGLRHSMAFIPPIIFLALVMDQASRFRWSIIVRTLIFSTALYLIYLPYLNFIGANWGLEVIDILPSVPITIVAVYISQLLLNKKQFPISVPVTIVVFSLLLFRPSFVLAHDPGQGEDMGQARLTAVQHASTVEINAELTDIQSSCENLLPLQVTVRRAGQTETATLQKTSNCRFEGTILLPEQGRWFIYLNWTLENQQLETWIPVIAQSAASTTEKNASVYKTTVTSGSTQQVLAGLSIYMLGIILLGGTVAVARRNQPMISE